jgi:putative NADPH-quinone reductase
VTALVVFTHPKPDAFARDLLDVTVDGLTAAGHSVTTIDLYRNNFDAALSREEWRAYPTPRPVVADERYAGLVREADVIAFVFPMWWSGPPSMLKGFFDRVLTPGVAFDLADTGRISPGLRHVRRVVVVTAAEPPGHFPHRSTRHLAHAFGRSLRRATGWRTRTLVCWAGPGITTSDETKRERFLARTRERLAVLR